MAFEVADHPAAPMKKDQNGQRAVSLGRIDSNRQLAVRARNGPVFNLGHRLRVFNLEERLNSLACLRHLHFVKTATTRGHELIDKGSFLLT